MDDSDKVFIVSSSGNYNFYDLTEINATGRATKGVRAIKLDKNEYIQTATIIRNGITYKGILSITNNGKGKITSIADFPMTSKGIKGNQVMSLKNETLALVYAVPDDQEKLFISANNKAVILEVAAIPTQNRMTSGSLIIDARNSNTTIEIM
jgi:DNA gyrase subunit A